MELADVLALAGQGSITGGAIWVMVYLHRQAIAGYRESVATWKAVAEREGERADEASAQVLRILAPVRDVAGAP